LAQSLFEHYGGFSVVRRIVSDLYDSILDSDQLAGYFEESDMRLRQHDEFALVERGEFDIKGFGTQTLYFLERELAVR